MVYSLFDSFRVWFIVFLTRSECSFTSFSLVSSVVSDPVLSEKFRRFLAIEKVNLKKSLGEILYEIPVNLKFKRFLSEDDPVKVFNVFHSFGAYFLVCLGFFWASFSP